jgi:hypothetical protein
VKEERDGGKERGDMKRRWCKTEKKREKEKWKKGGTDAVITDNKYHHRNNKSVSQTSRKWVYRKCRGPVGNIRAPYSGCLGFNSRLRNLTVMFSSVSTGKYLDMTSI